MKTWRSERNASESELMRFFLRISFCVISFPLIFFSLERMKGRELLAVEVRKFAKKIENHAGKTAIP